MSDTTMTLDESTKEQLANYRHEDHDSWTDVLNGMMKMLPSIEDIQEGCAECGETPWADVPSEQLDGFIQWFSHKIDGRTLHHSTYYCCSDCMTDSVERVQKFVPEHPDLVRVGGHEEPISEFTDASFYLDGQTKEVGLPIPGAFGGTNSFGDEYSYEGEPVYVKNKGDWIHSGVIEDILHEDAHTAILLDKDWQVEQSNHPDEERRESYENASEENTKEEIEGSESD